LPDNYCLALSGWAGSIWAAKNSDGNRLLITVEPSKGLSIENPNGYTFNELTTLEAFRLAFKPGKSVGDAKKGTIRLMNGSEMLATYQNEMLLLSDGDRTYAYGRHVAGELTPMNDTLFMPEFVFDNGGFLVSGRVRSYNPGSKVTIQLLQDEQVVHETSVVGSGTANPVELDFCFDNVFPGEYTLVLSKAVHTQFVVRSIIVESKDVDLTLDGRPEVRLMRLRCGDINDDGAVNDGDLTVMWTLSNYNRNTNVGADVRCDLNGDCLVNDKDLTILWLIENYNKSGVVVE
jgi:hypothetical protein